MAKSDRAGTEGSLKVAVKITGDVPAHEGGETLRGVGACGVPAGRRVKFCVTEVAEA